MNKITLGKTNLVIEKNGFGCLPIQRIREQDAVDLLHKAYDGGINFFDTARAYSDSEQKVGAAFSSMRDKIVLATKTGAQTAEGFWKDLETSLRTLKTDYIDIYQFHNPAFCPKPGGEDGLYDAALEAKKQGKIRHISITNHRLAVAHEAIDSGLYETLQFPFSYLAGEQEMELVRKCRETNMGFIAMKGMAGGQLIKLGIVVNVCTKRRNLKFFISQRKIAKIIGSQLVPTPKKLMINVFLMVLIISVRVAEFWNKYVNHLNPTKLLIESVSPDL